MNTELGDIIIRHGGQHISDSGPWSYKERRKCQCMYFVAICEQRITWPENF